MAGGEGGYWPTYIGELWDAASKGSSESVSVVDHGILNSRTKVWATTKGERRRWLFDADELIVFMVDVATVGHSMSESTDGVRSHHFLLNNRECATVSNLARQLSVFCKPD